MTRLGLSRTDIALALIFTVAAVLWVHAGRSSSYMEHTESPFPPLPPYPSLRSGSVTVSGSSSNGALINIIPTVLLAIRRRLPYTAFAIAFGCVLALAAVLDDVSFTWPAFLALMILAYSTVLYGRNLLGSFTLLLLAAIAAASQADSATPPIPGQLGLLVLIASVGLAAAAIRSTRARADAAAERAESLEREKEASTRAAIAEERARVARELHDVISHHVSVMVIQAGAAGKVIDSRPDLAGNALRAIESSGREAMGELRHLLGLVAPLDDHLHPQPDLGNLDTLISSVRAAGQPVTLHQETGTVPRDVNLTAYRVVQEGLTNALRYAPGAPTAVTLSREGDELVVEVRNGPPGNADTSASPAAAASAGGGAGLIGLTERLRLHRGTLQAGRRLGGGFRVTARIPLDPFDPISPTATPA